jgi:two-component system chemotaxis response regulator CheY
MPGANGPILVVDDDEVIVGFVAMALKDEGYEVLKAANGAAALALTRVHQPGMILLDMKMPVMDGWAFARAYSEQPKSSAPIVVMTAAADAAQRAADVGAAAFLPKPFELDALLELVERMTGRA